MIDQPADAPPAHRHSRSRWRSVSGWVGAAILVTAAGVVTQVIPDDLHEDDAFAASVSHDGWAANRDIRVRVDEVATAAAVVQESYGKQWRSEGNWITVQLRGEAISNALRGRIGDARLSIDGVTYRATESAGSDARSAAYTPGSASITTLAFELPADLDPSRATLRIWPSTMYPRLDTEIVFDLDLAAADHHEEVELSTAKPVMG